MQIYGVLGEFTEELHDDGTPLDAAKQIAYNDWLARCEKEDQETDNEA